jgi:DNA-binding IclR family transcriptional regulator
VRTDTPDKLSVTGKLLSVLLAFSAERPELTLTEIAQRAGLALTTAHRLIGELTSFGALERDASGRYRIGLRLWEVASLAPRGLGLRERAMPFMEDLYEITRENVQLAVREDLEVVFVERIAGRHAVSVRTRVGGRFPMHATGVGLVLLAYAPAEVQEQALAAPLRRFTEKTISTANELRETLDLVRRNGFALSNGQVTLDAISVAAPVFGPDTTVVAALSLVVRAEGAQPMALAPAVQAAARGLSRVLATITPASG